MKKLLYTREPKTRGKVRARTRKSLSVAHGLIKNHRNALIFPSRPGGVSFGTPKVHHTFTVVPKSGPGTDFVTHGHTHSRIHARTSISGPSYTIAPSGAKKSKKYLICIGEIF